MTPNPMNTATARTITTRSTVRLVFGLQRRAPTISAAETARPRGSVHPQWVNCTIRRCRGGGSMLKSVNICLNTGPAIPISPSDAVHARDATTGKTSDDFDLVSSFILLQNEKAHLREASSEASCSAFPLISSIRIPRFLRNCARARSTRLKNLGSFSRR